jgi:hypothetical protein
MAVEIVLIYGAAIGDQLIVLIESSRLQADTSQTIAD